MQDTYRDLQNSFLDYEQVFFEFTDKKVSMNRIMTFSDLQKELYYGYYVLDGMCRLVIANPKGGEKVTAVLRHGSFLSFYSRSQLERARHSMLLEPYPEVTALAFGKEEYEAMIREHGEIAMRLLRFYEDLTVSILCDLRDVLYCDGLKRVCNLIYDVAKAGGEDQVFLTQEEISRFIALDRTNVAKAMKTLREEQIIETSRGRIKIRDVRRLQELVNE